jgi:hypothetical protein
MGEEVLTKCSGRAKSLITCLRNDESVHMWVSIRLPPRSMLVTWSHLWYWDGCTFMDIRLCSWYCSCYRDSVCSLMLTAGVNHCENRRSHWSAFGAKFHVRHMQLKRLGVHIETYARRKGYVREWAWRREVANNSVWYQKLPVLEFMRLIGATVRMGPLLGRDT